VSLLTAGGLRGDLFRYRVMAWVVGVMLLFLCVVAIPLQFAADSPEVANVGFTIHGILYIVYLVSVAALARRAKFRIGQLVALVCAGFLPGLAFYVEHRTASRLLAEQAAAIDA
jgi:integral membrane protein